MSTATKDFQPIEGMKHKTKDIISLTKYAKINTIAPSGRQRGETTFSVTDLHTGDTFDITGKSLQDACVSADTILDTKEVTRSEMAEILVNSWGKPFTVHFTKADGKLRTLRGRLISSENFMGRSMVEDLDLSPDVNRLRQVDHRTMDQLIVDGINYYIK